MSGTRTEEVVKHEQAMTSQQNNIPSSAVTTMAQQNLVTGSQSIGTPVSAGQVTSTTTTSNILPQYQISAQVMGPAQAAATGGSRYQQLIMMIEELGKDVLPTYNGNRNSQERLKRGIIQARLMVRECMGELEKSRQTGTSSAAGN